MEQDSGLTCACFAFDLVAEGVEGDEEKLRGRLLQLLRCTKGEFPGTVPERGAKFGQQSDEDSSPVPYAANGYGHKVFVPLLVHPNALLWHGERCQHPVWRKCVC